jgi:hypothetical protein
VRRLVSMGWKGSEKGQPPGSRHCHHPFRRRAGSFFQKTRS